MKNKDRICNEDYIIEEDLRFTFAVNLLVSVNTLHIRWI